MDVAFVSGFFHWAAENSLSFPQRLKYRVSMRTETPAPRMGFSNETYVDSNFYCMPMLRAVLFIIAQTDTTPNTYKLIYEYNKK